MDTLLQDLRYGVRTLLKSPGFTFIAVIALALGIGANSAIFSVVNALLFNSLPYKNPDRLVMVWEDQQSRGGPAQEWTCLPTFSDWKDQNRLFDSMAAMINWGPTLTGINEPEQLNGGSVSYDMFSLLGTEPVVGRNFLPEDDQPGSSPVVILSHSLWQNRFGADPSILGKPLTLSGESYTVIGVLPAGFKFPILDFAKAEIWRPLRPTFPDRCGRGCYVLRVIARMKPDTTLEGAASEMNGLAARLAAQYPESGMGEAITLVPLQEQIVGNLKPALLILLASVGLVLLIACANVANLLLARATARGKEIAIRSALGARRSRLVRQLLTESLLLAIVGGALGLLLAFWMVDLLVAFAPAGTPRVNEIRMDSTVLGFTVAMTLLTGFIFGLAPALQTTKPDLNSTLKEGKGASSGASGGRIRSLLVVAEVALALILLVGAGLLIKSFIKLRSVDPGFNPENVLTVNVALPATRYPERQQAAVFYAELLEKVKALPGVESAGAASSLPLIGNDTDANFIVEGRPLPQPGNEPAAWYSVVTPDYLRAIGMRLVRGRFFTERDNASSPVAVIISQSMANRFWPDEDPVGKRLGTGDPEKPTWREIVGVVEDVKQFGLDVDARPTMYFSHGQVPSKAMTLTVRASSNPLNLASAVRSQVQSLDPNLAVSDVQTMEELLSTSIAAPRFTMFLLAVFSSLAMILAAVGIYGVISYAVTQRTHEIGIRVALGARSGDVLRLVVGQAVLLTVIGVGAGLVGAFALTRLMESLLFGVSATDPSIFILISVILIGVALGASFIPARRATKVDPMVALRYE